MKLHFLLALIIGAFHDAERRRWKIKGSDDEEVEKALKLLEKMEILGIPPTLQDVLRVIPDNYIEVRLSKPYLLLVNHNASTDVQYDLTKPLSEQSEETLDFLLDVIK